MTRIFEIDYHVDIMKSLLWQYNEAERLEALVRLKQEWYDANQQEFWESWYRDVFNLDTANDFGLTVWSIILGIALNTTENAQPVTWPTWGFGTYNQNFTRGNFRRINSGTIVLSREQKRLVLKLRYFQLVTKGAVSEINAFMAYIFGEGNVYVLDGLNMTAIYVFTFVPDSQLQFVLQRFDLLPRPAGVGLNYIINPEIAFGFDEFHVNFDRSNFALD